MKKTSGKRMRLLLACVMLLTLLPVPAPAADAPAVVASGLCGGGGSLANVRWELDETGLLRVFGWGDMGGGAVLGSGEPTALRIEEGVTSVCPDAFSYCVNLAEAEIPLSVTAIGSRAFNACAALRTVRYAGDASAWDAIAIADDWLGDTEDAPAVIFADGTHRCGAADYEAQNYVEGSCGMPGGYDAVRFCPVCGAESKRVQKTVDAEPHLWDDWTILTYPTATAEGLMERRCLRDETHVETAEIPAGAFGAHEVLRGYCGGEGDGKNLTWSLTDGGVVTISGTGRMRDYGRYTDFYGLHDFNWSGAYTYQNTLGPSVPWPTDVDSETRWNYTHGYTDDESMMRAILNGELLSSGVYASYYADFRPLSYTVVVEEGVTHVGANAFSGADVVSLSLPSTLEWVGQNAFSGLKCETLTLPEGVRYLDPYAFAGGEYVRVTLPSTVEVLGDGAISSSDKTRPLREITVLAAPEYLRAVLDGIDVQSLPASLPDFTHAQFTTLKRLEDLVSDYYFLYHGSSIPEEEVAEISHVLGIEITAEQRANLDAYAEDAFCTDINHEYGADVHTREAALAFITDRVNGILGTALTGGEIFVPDPQGPPNSLSADDIRLTPEADAAFAAQFGCGFSDVFFRLGLDYSLERMRRDPMGLKPAQWVTLRGGCGSALQSEYGTLVPFEALEHGTGNDGVITRTPDCVTPGERTVVCPVCEQVFTHEIPAPGHGHTLGLDESGAPATCARQGYRMTVCLDCGEVVGSEILAIDPDRHDWGEWEVLQQATPETEGLMRRVCKNDPDHVQEEVIPRYEEDEEGEPTSAIMAFVSRVVGFCKGIIDWFLRLFRKK